jgi:hypothetical protein
MSTFCRAVSKQEVLGSETEVVRVFIEALAIWDDLDIRAYAADVDGTFTQTVALAGADPALAPPVIDASLLPGGARFRRLPSPEIDHTGFAPEHVAVARVGDAGSLTWILALFGEIRLEDESRLIALIDVLGGVLSAARAVESSRLMWALLQCLASGVDSVEDTIGRALAELTDALDRPVALKLTRRDGAVLLSAGEGASTMTGTGVLARRPVSEGHELVLELDSAGGTLIREQQLIESAASLFASWLSAVLHRNESMRDRRGPSRTFDQLLEQQMRIARDNGGALAVVVLRPSGVPAVSTVQQGVREIRGRLRPEDMAATLATGEIGIVLPETSFEEASGVVERLRRSFAGEPNLAVFVSAAVGVASLAGNTLEDPLSLLAQARTRANECEPTVG